MTDDNLEDLPVVDATASWKRKLIWDILPCDRAMEFMPKLGVVPGSEEGESVEHRLSHQRMNSLHPIASVLATLGVLGGEVAYRAILESQGKEATEEEIARISLLGAAVSQAVVANLIQLGLVDITGGVYRGILG